MSIYFDNNATTKIKDSVLEKMMPYLTENFGNPSSTHTIGQQAKIAVDEAREVISTYIHSLPVEFLFTSCGTESNNWALKGVAEARSNKGKHIITTSVEHSSILKTLKHLEKLGYEVTYLPVDDGGHVSVEDFANAVRSDTILASIQYANSETGAIMPIHDIGKICKKHDIVFHCDAMQALNYLPVEVERLKVDLMTIGGHKIGGPKAIAGLYVKKQTPIIPLLDGGQQEYDLRAGTENVPYIVGFAEAIRILSTHRDEAYKSVMDLRDYFEKLISENIKDIIFNSNDPRLPNVSSISFLGIPNDTFLARLDMEGVYASAGAACTSGSIQVSEVLKSMNLTDEEANSTIRFSFSESNTRDEIEKSIDIIKRLVNLFREL